MRNKMAALAAALALAASLCGCGPREANVPDRTSGEDPVTLVLATDLHYISPAICDNGAAFHTAVQSGDGKTMYYIQEIMEAFVAEMTALAPDAVILSGDLTFSGAKASHRDLAELLEKLEEAGVPVLAIPGNHDLDSTSALAFSGEAWSQVESVTAQEFAQLYAPFGPEEAVSKDERSLSYVYAPRKDLRVLMVDANGGGWNSLPDETMEWVEAQLKNAKRAGAGVIAVSHQNLDIHNPIFSWGYQIVQGEQLRTLYEKYGVLCNLSGHLHIQHITDRPLPDIATSALSICPNQYGVLTYNNKELTYETRVLDVSGWAAEQGLTDPNLLDFTSYSKDFMIETARAKQQSRLEEAGVDPAEARARAATFARLNAVYFAGDPIDPADYDIDPDDRYLKSVLQDAGRDHHRWRLDLES